MNLSNSSENDFKAKLTELIEANLTNPQFGVSMLARELGMSRSNLHRKVFIISKISVSQFINQVRLKNAMEMLRHTSFTVSEVAHQTGFSNTSYFIKCFHQFYGYTPGEVGNRDENETDSIHLAQSRKKRLIFQLISIVFAVVLAVVMIIIFKPFSKKQNNLEKSVGALPFINISNDSTIEHFTFGLREEIISNLCKIKDLRVVGRLSMEKYKENPKPYPEIAKESNVNYIIEANCQKIENEIFLDVKLIEAPNDRIIWSQRYNYDFTDIFTFVPDVSKQIAVELNMMLSSDEIMQIEKVPTQNAEAYQLYLKGRYFWFRRTQEDLEKSIDYFNMTLDVDSNYSLAYAGLADAYFIMAYWEWLPGTEAWNKSKEYAQRSLKIDNHLAEAHAVLGGIANWYDKNWEVAEKELRLAIELDPNNAIAHQYYAEYLNNKGNFIDAIDQLDIALKLNPNAPASYSVRAQSYYDVSKFDEALNDMRKVSELNEDYLIKNFLSFKIYVRQGEDLKAIDELMTIISIYDPGMDYENLLKDIYSKSGMEGIIHWTIEWLLSKNQYDNSTGLFNDEKRIAELYSLTGETDSVLVFLERFSESGSVRKIAIKNSFDFKFLYGDPRFNALLKKMNLNDL